MWILLHQCLCSSYMFVQREMNSYPVVIFQIKGVYNL